MALINADFDSSMSCMENISIYEEQFRAVLSGSDGVNNSAIAYCQDILVKESGYDDPNIQYRNSPWTELDEFLKKNEVLELKRHFIGLH